MESRGQGIGHTLKKDARVKVEVEPPDFATQAEQDRDALITMSFVMLITRFFI